MPGQRLLRYDISMPGAAAIPRTLHTLAHGNAFVALAAPDGGLGGHVSPDQAHLLAASTLKEVLLLDLRRPGQALLRWNHGANYFLLNYSVEVRHILLMGVRLRFHPAFLPRIWRRRWGHMQCRLWWPGPGPYIPW